MGLPALNNLTNKIPNGCPTAHAVGDSGCGQTVSSDYPDALSDFLILFILCVVGRDEKYVCYGTCVEVRGQL